MARELGGFDWGEDGAGRRSKYDWTRWTKGDIWEIRKGHDYDIATETMRVTLHAQAEKRGLKVRTRKVGDGVDRWEGLVFQFYDRDSQE